jgi:hypothetical protein
MLVAKIYPIDEDTIRITGYREIQDHNYEADKWLTVSQEVYRFIMENVEVSHLSYKHPVTDITIADITVSDYDMLSDLKNTAIIEYKKFYLDRVIDSEFYITFIEFTLLNNRLASNGFFITKENREESYLDILNTGNMELIDSLEKYLNILDKICEYETYTENFANLKSDLVDADTIEEVKEIYTQYAMGDCLTKVVIG